MIRFYCDIMVEIFVTSIEWNLVLYYFGFIVIELERSSSIFIGVKERLFYVDFEFDFFGVIELWYVTNCKKNVGLLAMCFVLMVEKNKVN